MDKQSTFSFFFKVLFLDAMTKLHHLKIEWNYDTDDRMTLVQSSEPVLEDFFCMRNWEFIRKCFHDIFEETDTGFQEKRLDFHGNNVIFSINERETQLDRFECLRVFYHLYDVMIIGANDDHHSVRYEPWWQEFTEVFYQMKCKIEIENEF